MNKGTVPEAEGEAEECSALAAKEIQLKKGRPVSGKVMVDTDQGRNGG